MLTHRSSTHLTESSQTTHTSGKHEIEKYMADKRARVGAGYDAMAGQYLDWVNQRPSPRLDYLHKMLAKVGKRGTYLEIGCGAGVPVLQELVTHVSGASNRITGVDISEAQIKLAKTHCPEAELIQADMLSLDFDKESYDGIASFFAIFHLHRDEQPEFIRRLYKWLKPGGYFVGNFSGTAADEVKEQFFGAEMYWSSFAADETKAMFTNAGFVLDEASNLKEEGLKSSDPDYEVKFLWILAHKPEE